jgi:hypothetical protein
MDDGQSAKAPIHLWIVGLLALIWNGFGCYDYLMTRMRNMDYLKSAMQGVDPTAFLAWVDQVPLYVQIGWGLGVWVGLLGSILLLLRSRWAVWAFGASLAGAVVALGYQIAFAPPLAGMEGGMNMVMPYVIIVACALWFLYARAMDKKGVLR